VPELILGSSKNATLILTKGHNKPNHRHDLLLTFQCPDQWTVQASKKPTRIDQADELYYVVEPEDDCAPVFPRPPDFVEASNTDQEWRRLRFTLFSLMVSGSVFSAWSPMTFYTGFAILIAPTLKAAFRFRWHEGFAYEVTHPDAVIKLIESIYLKRHEEDLYMEEENYRCLQEIVRSPELFKALSGSSLAGGCDPILD